MPQAWTSAPSSSAAAAALLLGALLLGGCKDKAEDAPVKAVTYTGPILETRNVMTMYSDSARLQVRLKAPLEQNFENGDAVYPKGIDMTFFAKDGVTVVNTLRGNYAKYIRGESRYVVRGDVRVRNEAKQQSMRSEELYYDRPKARIYTEKFVRVETPTEQLTGEGLEANEDFSRYKILKPTGNFSADQATQPAGAQ